jgi:TonB family protein
VLKAVKLPFPEGLINARTVTVKLKIRIGADGTVEDVRVTESFQRGGLDVETMNVARQWLFTPATMDGKAVPVIADLILATTLDAKAVGAK